MKRALWWLLPLGGALAWAAHRELRRTAPRTARRYELIDGLLAQAGPPETVQRFPRVPVDDPETETDASWAEYWQRNEAA